jgi:hypothetical protein
MPPPTRFGPFTRTTHRRRGLDAINGRLPTVDPTSISAVVQHPLDNSHPPTQVLNEALLHLHHGERSSHAPQRYTPPMLLGYARLEANRTSSPIAIRPDKMSDLVKLNARQSHGRAVTRSGPKAPPCHSRVHRELIPPAASPISDRGVDALFMCAPVHARVTRR